MALLGHAIAARDFEGTRNACATMRWWVEQLEAV